MPIRTAVEIPGATTNDDETLFKTGKTTARFIESGVNTLIVKTPSHALRNEFSYTKSCRPGRSANSRDDSSESKRNFVSVTSIQLN